MSKKLIAVAAAAALALTGLVATPANASSFTVTINEGPSATASHNSATDPGAIAPTSAMTSRTLDYRTSASTSRNVTRFDVATVAGTTVEVTTTGGVLVVDAIANTDGTAKNVGAGSASYSKQAVTGSTTVTFYAYTTSSTAGSVIIQTPSQKATYFLKATVGAAYNLVGVKFPTSVTQGQTEADSTAVVSFKVTDVFGNEITTNPTTAATLAVLGGSGSTTITYSTLRKQYEAAVFSATASSVAMSVTLTATDLSANGFAKPVKYAFASVSAGDLATQVTTLTAQVTALQAQLAALTASTVTKAKYNKLVRKWNRANPSNKVKRVS